MNSQDKADRMFLTRCTLVIFAALSLMTWTLVAAATTKSVFETLASVATLLPLMLSVVLFIHFVMFPLMLRYSMR
jgi:Na+/serine symporter